MSNGPLYAMGGAHPHAIEETLEALVEEARLLYTEGGQYSDLWALIGRLAKLGPDAMQGLATGARKGKSKERKQEILTPASIANFVRQVFDGEIVLDPCAAYNPIEDHVQASLRYFGGPDDDGLKLPWEDGTYCNPPFKYLKAWLAKALTEARGPEHKRIIVLAPQRPHRAWFRDARNGADFVLELNGVKFVGYDSAFPAPLCLMGFNCVPNVEAGKELGGFL